MTATVHESGFRSEEMSLCQIYIKKDAAYSVISELGEVGLVHFNNLNESENIHRLRYVQEMSYCAEMQRILRFLRHEVEQAGITIPEIKEDIQPIAPNGKDMIELRTLLEKMEMELLEITTNYEALRMKYFNLLEINQVLVKADEFFLDASTHAWSDSLTKTLLLDTNDLRSVQIQKDGGLKLSYLTGTIPFENFFAFERFLWRACRGNFFIRHSEIEEVHHKKTTKKFVFIVFFQGDVMENRIRMICQGFRTSLYQCPESSRDRLKQLASMENTIKDLQIVLEQTDYHRRRVLSVAATDLSLWRIRVKKVMAVYYVMNQMGMDEAEKYSIAECWIPTANILLVQQALYRGAMKAGSSVSPILTNLPINTRTPPTFNRTNRILVGFQMLVDAYGVGNYRELNPAPYTIVTFPFLFAVMFGDMGHGTLITLFATWMVLKEKQLSKKTVDNEIWKIVFGGRYIILLMGLFSIFTGLVYNDIFSKSFSIFHTAWKVSFNDSTILSNNALQLNPATAFQGSPHIFGMDPIWDTSGESAIVTMNSFKMKVAIILGVLHMFFGMALAAWNHIFFGNYIDLIGVCIPQMVFFSLFLYLVFLIFLKWILYSADGPMPYNSHCAPSILIIFIDMVLFKESGPIPAGCQRYMFQFQGIFQNILVTLALLCVPIILFTRPLYIVWRKIKAMPKGTHKITRKPREKRVTFANNTKNDGSEDGLIVRILESDVEDQSSGSSYSAESDNIVPNEDFHNQDISEVFIIQGIRTIETVLGSVSHTASYLRLWALSLAHDQLSSVLWNMVLRRGLKSDDWKGAILLVFTFCAWSLLTLTILVLMEGLSAFLHTLRLHWVEFQSKFYAGSGTLFKPFDFKEVLAINENEQ